jgi:hypothetical protein
VFFDVVRIAPGQDFHAVIDDQLRASGALLVLIGKTWVLTARSGYAGFAFSTPICTSIPVKS